MEHTHTTSKYSCMRSDQFWILVKAPVQSTSKKYSVITRVDEVFGIAMK